MEEHAWGVEATKPRPVDGCDGVLAGVIVGSSGNTPSYTRSPVSNDVSVPSATAKFVSRPLSLDRECVAVLAAGPA